jgi:aerotaxis receptor
MKIANNEGFFFVLEVDFDGKIIFAGTAILNVFGYTEDEIFNKHYEKIIDAEMKTQLIQEHQEHLKNNDIWEGYVKNTKKNGEIFWSFTTLFKMKNYFMYCMAKPTILP